MPRFSSSLKLASAATLLLLAACASKPAVTTATTNTATTNNNNTNVIVPGSAKDFEVNVGDRVLFDLDGTSLDDGDRATLQKQASWLAKYPAVTLSVEGHADERGTREYNLALGARRAASVKEYLTSLGVSSSRLESISYGKERPVCAESNESCWAQNRRGVSVITAGATS